jgi:formylglycine-generating enzyme required for sulfatase activity
MKTRILTFTPILAFFLTTVTTQAAPPFVTYAGQVASGGQPFNGTGQFKFAFVNADANVTYWSQDGTSSAGSQPTGQVSAPVNGGYYSILLGNTAITGMGAIDPAIFKTYSDVHLRVWFSDGVAAFEEMSPHRPFASVPYALNAGVADGSISSSKLETTILTYLKPEVSGPPKAVRSLTDFQKKIILESRATGKYLTYQWKKNGSALPGETNATLVISDANATHDGNYTVAVTNAFGSVETPVYQLGVAGHNVPSAANLEMLWVEPGTFTMGSPTTETGRGSDETEHNVTLTKGFYLGKYEVTQAQYEAVMTGNANSLSPAPSNWPNNPNRPVEKVSWDDVQIFLTRLNAAEQAAGRLPANWQYVLPTESQWEYACRAGTTTVYSWGAAIATSNANYNSSGLSQTTDVGQYAANPWGFFDMHGNVWEWTNDWYQVAYPTGNPVIDPTGPASGSYRVLRGGSWFNGGAYLRSAQRDAYPPSTRHNTLGFRVGFQQVQPDTANPELVLSGGAEITHEAGQPWAEPGMAAHDVRDGNLTSRVSIAGLVDANTTGLYVLTYTVFDSAGNLATANRKVNVQNVQASTHVADLNATVQLQMLWVSPGTFTMGSPTSETGRGTDETEHNVTLTKGFYLGKYEVTQAQYEAVMTGNTNSLSATPSQYSGNPNRPVEKVSWDDVQIFLTRLNAAEQTAGRLPAGWAYVLPTESQWEYACRAGTTTAYSWGATIATSNANYNNTIGQTADVGQYAANPWGFFDMHGNVFEWTADWYQAAYPIGNPVVDPTGPASGSRRVKRGGSWTYGGTLLRSAQRDDSPPSYRNLNLGFRVGFQKQ